MKSFINIGNIYIPCRCRYGRVKTLNLPLFSDERVRFLINDDKEHLASVAGMATGVVTGGVGCPLHYTPILPSVDIGEPGASGNLHEQKNANPDRTSGLKSRGCDYADND